ncbi:hypothetical protein BDP27DRAFT_1430119 [Rhodocollybia butyracea]|uniref:Uncharacterized protein n=1 Tax=Rhodocollybia butyracea TaxID=206335 RepID=A0A9P5P8T4_9AGAR|nr:hypothetical protein BDP27DRAFT_1430119 [Rhodocollybia butyracea]
MFRLSNISTVISALLLLQVVQGMSLPRDETGPQLCGLDAVTYRTVVWQVPQGVPVVDRSVPMAMVTSLDTVFFYNQARLVSSRIWRGR